MRTTLLFLASLLVSIFLITSTYATISETNPVYCTADYTPVCGSVQVQCIQAPCDPIRQTFSNACMAGVAHASDVTKGECQSLEVVIVGGDSDEHGCKASAGYSWDSMMKQCIRPWEKSGNLVTWAYGSGLTRFSTVDTFGFDRGISRQEAAAIFARAGEKLFSLRYASYPDICNISYLDESAFDTSLKNDIYSACALDMMHGNNGFFSPHSSLTRAEAIVVIMRAIDGGKRDESKAKIWYSPYTDRANELGIFTFTNFDGFDKSISRGELIEWIFVAQKYQESKNPAITEDTLLGKWTLEQFHFSDGRSLSGVQNHTFTLDLESGKISAKFCNSLFGSYSLSGTTFSAPAIASTMMYCEGIPTTLENAFQLDGAVYTFETNKLILRTKNGNVFTWKR